MSEGKCARPHDTVGVSEQGLNEVTEVCMPNTNGHDAVREGVLVTEPSKRVQLNGIDVGGKLEDFPRRIREEGGVFFRMSIAF